MGSGSAEKSSLGLTDLCPLCAIAPLFTCAETALKMQKTERIKQKRADNHTIRALSALRQCVRLNDNRGIQFLYVDQCLLLALGAVQRKVLQHRISANHGSRLVPAAGTEDPFVLFHPCTSSLSIALRADEDIRAVQPRVCICDYKRQRWKVKGISVTVTKL